MHLEGCLLPGSSLHAHACKSMHAACCLVFLACSRMQIHTCSHKGLHCPRHNAVEEIQNYYNIQILLQSENHFTVRKYYNACTQILQSSNITVLKQHYYKSKPQSNNYNSQVIKHTHVSISIKQPVRNAVTKGIHLFTICAIRGRLCFWLMKIGFSRHKVKMMI